MPKTKEQLEQSRIRRADKLKRINEFRILQMNQIQLELDKVKLDVILQE